MNEGQYCTSYYNFIFCYTRRKSIAGTCSVGFKKFVNTFLDGRFVIFSMTKLFHISSDYVAIFLSMFLHFSVYFIICFPSMFSLFSICTLQLFQSVLALFMRNNGISLIFAIKMAACPLNCFSYSR